MKATRRRDTLPERLLRSELHSRGRRFRIDHAIVDGAFRARPDIVFTRVRVAVFVDGCFWHLCPQHGAMPQANRGYWEPKLNANVARDLRTNGALTLRGWRVVRIWEHEAISVAADRVDEALQRAGSGLFDDR
jgi:DNA mismatch endonuclease, patch repair protein